MSWPECLRALVWERKRQHMCTIAQKMYALEREVKVWSKALSRQSQDEVNLWKVWLKLSNSIARQSLYPECIRRDYNAFWTVSNAQPTSLRTTFFTLIPWQAKVIFVDINIAHLINASILEYLFCSLSNTKICRHNAPFSIKRTWYFLIAKSGSGSDGLWLTKFNCSKLEKICCHANIQNPYLSGIFLFIARV